MEKFYTVKLMRKYGDGKSKTHNSNVMSATKETIKDRGLLAARMMRDTAIDGGFYDKKDFYGMVTSLGNVLYEFDIDDGGML